MRKKEGDKNGDILDAAIRVFAREGFDRAQISAIAAEAGVGTGSVYLYFPNKEGILDGVFERFWGHLLATLRELPSIPPREHLAAQLRILFDALSRDRNMVAIYLREMHRHTSRPEAPGNEEREACLALGEETYRKGVQERCFQAGIPLGLARAFVFGGIRSALSWSIDPGESSRDAGDPEAIRTSPDAFREMAIELALSVLLPNSSPKTPIQEVQP